jgi:hypothetical protein
MSVTSFWPVTVWDADEAVAGDCAEDGCDPLPADASTAAGTDFTEGAAAVDPADVMWTFTAKLPWQGGVPLALIPRKR